jgi:DNA polymerase-1
MIHRCRFKWGGGLADGEYQIVFNFFRTLRSLVDEFKPKKVYFPLDGKPKKRIEAYDEYKANRKVDLQDPEVAEYWASFHRQKRIIINSLKENYPITTVYHPDYECDDIILHLVKNVIPADEQIVIVSSDTDFIQIINNHDNVSLYNPVSTEFREKTNYDYVAWKSMVGDKSDNINGIKGIGIKTAQKILLTSGELDSRLKSDDFRSIYEKNYDLIRLHDLSEEDKCSITFSRSAPLERDVVEKEFMEMNFQSLLKEETLEKYFNTFESIGK